jgi:hypothetical protein
MIIAALICLLFVRNSEDDTDDDEHELDEVKFFHVLRIQSDRSAELASSSNQKLVLEETLCCFVSLSLGRADTESTR